jgi:hypothetical protein
MIAEIFNELNPYLRGIKKADNYSIVEVHIKNNWLIPEHGTISSQKKETKERGIVWYMFYSESDSFDNIIDWLRDDVIEMNIEIEQKEELLKSKVAQLKEVFENSSLDELKKLEFSQVTEDPLKLGAKTEEPKKEKVES